MVSLWLFVPTLVLFFQGTNAYVAASVQYTASWSSQATPRENVLKNVHTMANLVEATVKSTNASLIAFPEGLFMELPEGTTRDVLAQYGEELPETLDNACLALDNSTHPQLKILACTARKFRVTIFSSIIDVQPCSSVPDQPCPPDNRLIWNTAIIITPQGLAAKYHKSHLSGEYPTVDQPIAPKMIIHETDFGARIGVFICQDLIFEDTANFYDSSNIDTLVWITSWGNIIPSVTGNLLGQAYAVSRGVNVVTADRNRKGGGVVAAGGKVLSWNFDEGSEGCINILTHPVCIGTINSMKDMTAPLKTDGNQTSLVPERITSNSEDCYLYQIPMKCSTLRLNGTAHSTYAQFGNLTCVLEYSGLFSGSENFVLYAMEFDYPLPGTPDTPAISLCSVIRCDNFPDCTPDPTQALSLSMFYHFSLHARGLAEKKPVQYAWVSTGYSMPVSPEEFKYTKNGPHIAATTSWKPKPIFALTTMSVTWIK